MEAAKSSYVPAPGEENGSVQEAAWVVVSAQELGGTGFRRKFTDFYGFRTRLSINSRHITLEDVSRLEEDVQGREYEELYEVGIQFASSKGLPQHTDAWVPVSYLVPDEEAHPSAKRSNRRAQQLFAVFTKVFHRWINRGKPLIIHKMVSEHVMPGKTPTWLPPGSQRTPQNIDEFVQAMSSEIYDKLQASKLSRKLTKDIGDKLKHAYTTNGKSEDTIKSDNISLDEDFYQKRLQIAQLRESKIGGLNGLHDTILQKLDSANTSNTSSTFEILKVSQLLGFQNTQVNAATSVMRAIIQAMSPAIKSLQESMYNGGEKSSQDPGLDLTDMKIPFSIFERALFSNMLGRQIIAMALEGKLENHTFHYQSRQLSAGKEDTPTEGSDLDSSSRLVARYLDELDSLRLLNHSLAGEFVSDEEYALVYEHDESTENNRIRGADCSVREVGELYKKMLTDLEASERRRSSMWGNKGEDPYSYMKSIDGSMWKDLDPSYTWLSPMSMMQTRRCAWHKRKMHRVKDLSKQEQNAVTDEEGSKSNKETHSEKSIEEMKGNIGMEEDQAYYYMSNRGDISFAVPNFGEIIESYSFEKMEEDDLAPRWTLFRNVLEQDAAGADLQKRSDAVKSRKQEKASSLNPEQARSRFMLGCSSAGGFEDNLSTDGYVSYDWAELNPATPLARYSVKSQKNRATINPREYRKGRDGIKVQVPGKQVHLKPGHPVFLSGKNLSLDFDVDDRVWDLKVKIEAKEGLPAMRQELVINNKKSKARKLLNHSLVRKIESSQIQLKVLPPEKPYKPASGTLHRIPEPRWRCEGLGGLQSCGSGLIWVPGVDEESILGNRHYVLNAIANHMDAESLHAGIKELSKDKHTSEMTELRKYLVKHMKASVETTGMIKTSNPSRASEL